VPQIRIKLSQLIEAVEFDFEEQLAFVDLENGSVIIVDSSEISSAEEVDEEEIDELLASGDEDFKLARAIVDDSGERFLAAPNKFDFHEYGQMERFIGTVEDARISEELWRAIKGRGAFRHFKDTASRFRLLDEWYRYRDAALKDFVIHWAESNKLPYEDDIKSR